MEKINDLIVGKNEKISKDDFYQLAVKLVELPDDVRNGVKELAGLLNRQPNDSYHIPERLLNGFEGFFTNLYDDYVYNTGAVRGNSSEAARKLSKYFGEKIERAGSGERIKELITQDFVKNLETFKNEFNALKGDKKDNFVALIRNEVLKDGEVVVKKGTREVLKDGEFFIKEGTIYKRYCGNTGDNYVFFSKGNLDRRISDFNKKYLVEDIACSLMNINKDR